jgi:hypothetical protein
VEQDRHTAVVRRRERTAKLVDMLRFSKVHVRISQVQLDAQPELRVTGAARDLLTSYSLATGARFGLLN